jgi:hypothetical protein
MKRISECTITPYPQIRKFVKFVVAPSEAKGTFAAWAAQNKKQNRYAATTSNIPYKVSAAESVYAGEG